MLSKSQIKHIRSLSLQKYRKEYKQFTAEGEKIANEWLQCDNEIAMIVATRDWVESNTAHINRHKEASLHIVEESILSTISSLKTAHKVLLVVALPRGTLQAPVNEWIIALDGIQDPGNMGSIIRIADWFGVKNLICSPECVDIYNPKVIQAGMGSHLRIQFFEEDLGSYFERVKIPVLAAVLNGDNIYELSKPDKAVILIGNEGSGIDQQLVDKATQKITIPSRGGAESLNAAISTGILCALLLPR